MNYPELLLALIKSESIISPRGEKTKELMNVSFQCSAQENAYDFYGVRGINKLTDYWFKELAWFMSGVRDTEFIEQHAKLWKNIKNADGTANSNYGWLVFYNRNIHGITPYEWCLHSLSKDRDTRQAVMTYNNAAFNYPGNRDYICTQHQAFFIRGNKLRCFVALRSSDAIWGLPYNMLWWSFVQQQLRLELISKYPGLELGDIEVTAYSAHLYERHFKLTDNMIACEHSSFAMAIKEKVPLNQTIEWYLDNIRNKILFIKNS